MDVAEERVRDWKPGTPLELSWLRLTELPRLPPTLTSLRCCGNFLTSLPPLPPTLEILHCSANRELTSLPDLPSSLRILLCNGNDLSALPELPSSLVFLNCSDNKLKRLPDSLSETQLTQLYVSENQLTALPAVLPTTLTSMSCFQNALVDLPPLPPSLETFNCGKNSIRYLPPLPASLTWLCCKENRLTCLPEPMPTGLRFIDILEMENICLPDVYENSVYENSVYSKNIARMRAACRDRIQARTRALKEELVAAVFHPRRVAAWMDAGYEPEDM